MNESIMGKRVCPSEQVICQVNLFISFFFNKRVNAMMMIIDNNQNADDTLHFSVLSNIMMDF